MKHPINTRTRFVSGYLSDIQIVEDMLKNVLTEEEKNQLKSFPDEFHLSTVHHGLGTFIRNHYRLWNPDNKYTEIANPIKNINGIIIDPKFPDNFSFRVIVEIYRKVRKTD